MSLLLYRHFPVSSTHDRLRFVNNVLQMQVAVPLFLEWHIDRLMLFAGCGFAHHFLLPPLIFVFPPRPVRDLKGLRVKEVNAVPYHARQQQLRPIKRREHY